jgi:aspartyl-tRNA(Asn)/glutamyl-tRNA(Gln) amidotransferase subunit C
VTLTAEQVRDVAQLARLGLDEDQIREYAAELSRIVDIFANLARAEAAGVEPMAHPLDLTARLRADEPVPVTDRDAFQALAPDTADGVYRVPKVIE